MSAPDLIDAVVGIVPGSPLDLLRRGRPDARTHTQASAQALFEPVSAAEVSLLERAAVASFAVALQAGEPGSAGAEAVARLAERYDGELAGLDPDLASEVAGLARAARRPGPFGVYREPGLAGESEEGPLWVASPSGPVSPRLAAALTHTALLVLRPRESSPQALGALEEAGWSRAGIVTLSQLVSFLAYQVRLAHGLATLAATPATEPVAVGAHEGVDL